MFNHPYPPWMSCFSDYYNYTPNCIGLDEIDQCPICSSEIESRKSCFNYETDDFSACLFYKHRVIEFGTSKDPWTLPPVMYIIHMSISFTIAAVVIVKTLKDLDSTIRVGNVFILTSLTVMISVITLSSFRIQGILLFFNTTWRSFFDLGTWIESIKSNIISLKLYEAGNVLFGSFTPVTVNTGIRSSYLCMAHLLSLVVYSIFAYLLIENLYCQLDTNPAHYEVYSLDDLIFCVYPEALGLLAAAPVWGSLYFIIIFIVTLQTGVLQLIIIEGSLSEEIISSSYYIYTRFLLLLVAFLLCLFLGVNTGDSYLPYYMSSLNLLRLSAVFFFYCVLVLYGFQRLFDDIYFLLKNPPSCFYKTSWCMSLFISGTAFFIFFYYKKFTRLVDYIAMGCLILSLALGFLVKFIKYLKARNLMSMFRQAENWGPSSTESKNNRKLFNPRYEVRFRRRVETCKHRCLLNSVVVKRTVDKELSLVSNVLFEMEENEENRRVKIKEIRQLQKHRKIMAKILAQKTREDFDLLFTEKQN